MRFRWALIIVWLFLWLGLPAAGQGDALSYRLREPDSTFMQVCREDKAFQYVVPDESSDWLENFERWWREFRRRYMPGLEIQEETVKKVLAVLGGLLIAFLLYKLLRSKYVFAPREKQRYESMNALVGARLDGQSYPVLVEKAVARRDYVLALRIHYWYVLQLLDADGRIHWDACRTNWAYCHELKEEELKAPFLRLTRIFEYVCYGEFQIDNLEYERLSREFEDFRDLLEQQEGGRKV